MQLPDEQFEQLINQSLDELPQQYIEGLRNVAITYEDEPTAEQRRKLRMRGNETLYGLYEGVPLPQRGGVDTIMPDRITIFKNPMLHAVIDMVQLKATVKHTLWHEIAHYYGLDHDRIHEIERNWK